MTNHIISSLDDCIVDSGFTSHMAYDESILYDIQAHNSQISIGVQWILKLHAWVMIFYSSSSPQPTTQMYYMYLGMGTAQFQFN